MGAVRIHSDQTDDRGAGLVHKFSWVAISGFGRQLAFFIINGYLACCLSKVAFGTLTCAYGALMVFVGVADFGLRQHGWRHVARNPHRTADVVNSLMAARLLMTGVALVGYLATAIIFCHGARDWWIFLLYSFGLFFNMSSFDFPFLGRDKMDLLGRSYAIAYAYFVPACLLTIRDDSTAWLMPVHFVIAHTILFALLYRNYRRHFGPIKLSFDRRKLKHHFDESWSLGINSLLFRTAVNYPVLLLGVVVSSLAAAEYRLAEMFYGLFTSLGLYLGSSTFTTYASYERDNDERITQSVTVAVQTILLGLVPVGLLFVSTLPLVFVATFPNSSPNLTIICWFLGASLPMAVVTRYLQTCLPSIGLNKELLKVNFVYLVVGVCCGAAMTFAVGGWGVAASVLISEFASLCLLLALVRQRLPGLQIAPMLSAPLVAAVLCGVLHLLFWTMRAPHWLQVVAPIVVAAPILWRLSAVRMHLSAHGQHVYSIAAADGTTNAEPIRSKAA
jgi:O-antigen/teichoic acid export membrane protein